MTSYGEQLMAVSEGEPVRVYPDQLLVGTYPGHGVGTVPSTSLELGTLAPNDEYGSMHLEAGTRDIKHNASLTYPPQYFGGPAVTHSASVSPFTNKPFLSMSETSYQQQQRVNERPGQLLSEFHLLLKRISDSLDPEQVNSLCYVSVEAEKAGIRNREDFSGIVLLDFFHKMMLITPNNLIYLTNQLHAIDRMDLCSLIDQYNARIHSLQRGEIPVEDRPPPYNPEFVSAPVHGQLQPHPVHCVSSANTTQPMAPMLGSLSEQNSYSLPFQVQDDDNIVSQREYNHHMHKTFNRSQVMNRVDNGFESPCGAVTYLTDEQLLNRQLKEQVARLQSRLKDKEDLVARQGARIVQLEGTTDRQRHIINHKNGLIESLIASCPVEKYSMNKIPHGIAVIINNYEFHSADRSSEPLANRPGSCADEEHLRSTMEYLGYEVCILSNLSALDLTQRLKQVALQSHENYDSFVCCILSHGDLGGVFGADGKLVKINKIASLFKPTKCPTLAGKPKLFFIQACRGETEDPGYVLEKDGKGDEPFRNSLPNDADFLFGYATPPGNVSWRSRRHGTWYISSLCEVLHNHALQRDLLTMLTIVNYKVSEAFTDQGYKQCPAPVTLLRKQVWFFSRSTE